MALTPKKLEAWPQSGGTATLKPTAQLSGIAVEPDGKFFWVADSHQAEGAQDKTGFVYRIETATGKIAAEVSIKNGSRAVYAEYVTLETDSSGKVVRIWVSDQASSNIYYFAPSEATAKALNVDSTNETRLRGVVWDAANSVIWAADDALHRLVAIEPNGGAPKISTKFAPTDPKTDPLPGIAKILVVGNRVWFTQYLGDDNEEFHVGFYDAGSTAAGSRITRVKVDSNPYGLALSADKTRIWVATSGSSALWAIDGIATTAPIAKRVLNFDEGDSPRDMVVDKYGYIWVTLNTAGKVAEVMPDGSLRGTYILTDAYPADICYLPNQDALFVSDIKANSHRGLLLWPQDRVDPTIVGPDGDPETWLIVAEPKAGTADKGQVFKPWNVVVKSSVAGNAALKDKVLHLSVDDPKFATLGGGISYDKTTDTGGTIPVNDLKALDTEGSVTISALVRGRKAPVKVYTAMIGKAVTGVTGNNANEMTHPDTDFPHAIKVVVAPAQSTMVHLKIEPGAGSTNTDTVFGKPGTPKEIELPTDNQGELYVPLRAGKLDGKVKITATVVSDPTKTLVFERQVNPWPDAVVLEKASAAHLNRDRTNQSAIEFSVSGKNSAGTSIPLEGEPISITLAVGGGKDGTAPDKMLRFVDNSNPGPGDKVTFSGFTNANGKLVFDGQARAGFSIYCPLTVTSVRVVAVVGTGEHLKSYSGTINSVMSF